MKLKTKITKKLLVVGVLSILLTALSLSFAFWYFYSDQVKNDLVTYSDVAVDDYKNSAYEEDFSLYEKIGVRVTIIDEKGKVVFDNHQNLSVAEIENHNDRPEIIEAREKGIGKSTRDSETIGKMSYYYAVMLDDGNVLRVSKETGGMFSVFGGMIPIIIFIILYVFAICLAFSAEATKSIIKPIEDMAIDTQNVSYEELIPFSNTIEEQRQKINKQMEKLQQERDKIAILIANMSEGFVLFDLNKNVLMKNDSALKLLQANDVINVNAINFLRNEKFLKCVDKAIKGENNYVELNINEKTIQVMASPVFSNKVQNGAICIILDITKTKKAETMRREFTANVSHELKTPLTSISGYAEMIELGMAKPEDVKGFAHKICRESGRLVSLISDILKLSQLDEPLPEKQTQEINLTDLAHECVEDLKMNAQKHNVSISAEGESLNVMGNRNLLYELIYNLCDNAIRYNKHGGSVKVEIKNAQDNMVQLQVIDTGIGIPLDHQDRIFERFYRVDKSRSKETGGTGLGLAIVKYIAEQHKASIKLESQQDKGTKITVEFPKEEVKNRETQK